MSVRAGRPPTKHAAAALFVGLLVGTALVAPVVPPLIAALPSPASFGPVASVLVVGVLSLVVFVPCLVTLYLLFALAEAA